MSTANSVITQLQSDLQLANDTTGASDVTIHDAIGTLISGFGSGGKIKKHTGTTTRSSNGTDITHNCNSSKYLMIINASGLPEDTGGVWNTIHVIGLYDETGLNFDNGVYNTVSAATRYNGTSKASLAFFGTRSTKDVFNFYGNTLPLGIECTWELYDLSDD